MRRSKAPDPTDERAAIVRWLRSPGFGLHAAAAVDLADDIELGAHYQPEHGGVPEPDVGLLRSRIADLEREREVLCDAGKRIAADRDRRIAEAVASEREACALDVAALIEDRKFGDDSITFTRHQAYAHASNRIRARAAKGGG